MLSFRNQLDADLLQFARHTKAGHLLKYFYTTARTGSTQISDGNAAYYIFREDISNLQCLIGRAELRQYDQLYDLGPGDIECFELKIRPILDAGNITKYVAIDFDQSRANAVCEHASKRYRIESSSSSQDIFSDKQLAPFAARAIIAILGQTFGDLPLYEAGTFPRYGYLRLLSQFKKRFGTDSLCLISIDTNRSAPSLLDVYSSPVTKEFLVKGAHSLIAEPTGKPASLAWEPRIFYDAAAQAVCFCLRLNQPISITLASAVIELPADKDLIIGVSYRMSIEQIRDLFSTAGLDIVDLLLPAQGTTALVVLKT